MDAEVVSTSAIENADATKFVAATVQSSWDVELSIYNALIIDLQEDFANQLGAAVANLGGAWLGEKGEFNDFLSAIKIRQWAELGSVQGRDTTFVKWVGLACAHIEMHNWAGGTGNKTISSAIKKVQSQLKRIQIDRTFVRNLLEYVEVDEIKLSRSSELGTAFVELYRNWMRIGRRERHFETE